MKSPLTSSISAPSSPASTSGTFDTAIKGWLGAMSKARRIKPGGRLVFINKKTGSAVPASEASPTPQNV